MADLRSLLEGLGYGNVTTLLQSGNAVFTASKGTERSIGRAIEAALVEALEVQSTIILRSSSELAEVVRANPFPETGADPKQLHAVFLSAQPAAAKVQALSPEDYEPDEVAFGDRVAYLRLPNGVAGSRLPALDKPLGVDATMRTWNTVTRVAAVAADIDRP